MKNHGISVVLNEFVESNVTIDLTACPDESEQSSSQPPTATASVVPQPIQTNEVHNILLFRTHKLTSMIYFYTFIQLAQHSSANGALIHDELAGSEYNFHITDVSSYY